MVYSNNLISGVNINGNRGNTNLKLHAPNEDLVGTYAETGEGGLPENTRFVTISDNVFGGSGFYCVAIRPQTTVDERIYDVIFERNRLIHDYGTTGNNAWQIGLMFYSYYLTTRNNVFDASHPNFNLLSFYAINAGTYSNAEIGEDSDGIPPTNTGIKVYNNTFYSHDNTLSGSPVGVKVKKNVQDIVIKNNYTVYTDATATIIDVLDESTSTIAVSNNNANTKTSYLSDPGNTTPISRNYSLLSTATATIDQGYSVPVYDDFDADKRTGTFDIGAHMYGEVAAQTTAKGFYKIGGGVFRLPEN